MIARRRRKNVRSRYEQDLKNGRQTPLHLPKYIAARDFVLHGENLNPFPPDTPNWLEYEQSYTQTAKDITVCRAMEKANEETTPQPG